MAMAKLVLRDGYDLLSIVNGANYHYRCLICGGRIDDDPTGKWTTLHTGWHNAIQPADPQSRGDR